MKKTLKYVFLLLVFSLVITTSYNSIYGEEKTVNLTEQISVSKASVQSSYNPVFSEDFLDDEQVFQNVTTSFNTEKVDFIKIQQNSSLHLQPCLVPWQPPKA